MAQIKANGVSLEYDVSGPENGVPLLLIMGFGTQMTGWPDEFRQGFVDAGLRVIRFDNRDVGLSQKWDGVLPDVKAASEAIAKGEKPDVPYTLNDMAADAAALLDELGIESAHIAGTSMGGMIAQLVALNHPEKTRSLISIFSTTSDPSLPRSSPEPPDPQTVEQLPAAQQYPAARMGSLLSTGVPVGGSVRVSVLVGSDSKFPADVFGLS